MFTFGSLHSIVNKVIHYATPTAPSPHKSLSRRSVAAHATPYMRTGHSAVSPSPITVRAPLGSGPSGPVEVQLEVHHPAGPPPRAGWPLALVSPGFLLSSSLYRSYAASLASWGFCVALVDLLSDALLDDTLSVVYTRAAIDVCGRDPRVAALADPQNVFLVGHSRGAKISTLAAAEDARVKGLALIDPVDRSSMGPSGPGYPSALPALRAAAAARRLPVLVVGAGTNGDVVEAAANWSNFTRAAAAGGAPTWEVTVLSCGHLQFLDKQMGLFSMFSGSGETRDEDVRLITQSAIAAWSQVAVLPSAGLAAPPPGGAEDAIARERAALSRVAPIASEEFHFGALPAGAFGGASSAAGSSGGGGSREGSRASTPRAGSGAAGAAFDGGSSAPGTPRSAAGAAAAAGAGQQTEPLDLSLDDLMGMRARELKALLSDRGVDASDVFEKEGLARRVYETCCRR